ncbi:DUF2243 domain-containing protein [Mesorhizobium sp. BR1-1-4]|nr:DUF2243 domain-containing protein [Mesorhizobium sp. BR1-1-4]
MDAIAETFDRRIRAGWLLLGFALGGFLDGIVLHQILQWHHLLSGLADPAGSNLRFQIMADGLFHLFMYVLAVAGAVLLVAARAAGARPGTTTEILRVALVGFGVWHIFDAVLFHWLLGLHRIKMNSDMPLAWEWRGSSSSALCPFLWWWCCPTAADRHAARRQRLPASSCLQGWQRAPARSSTVPPIRSSSFGAAWNQRR